jgi:hypothetical protein
MVMPRFAQVRRAIRMRDALVISCWVAGNAFLLTSCFDLSPDSSGAGALVAWIVLLAFSLLWLVEAACGQAGHVSGNAGQPARGEDGLVTLNACKLVGGSTKKLGKPFSI